MANCRKKPDLMRNGLWQCLFSLLCRRYFLSQFTAVTVLLCFKIKTAKKQKRFSIYITGVIFELQWGWGGFVERWFLAESVLSTLQTTFHFQHRHIFFYCLSTRGYLLLLTAILMTILVSCKITVPMKEQLLQNFTFVFSIYIRL